jgi:hypothetical protein
MGCSYDPVPVEYYPTPAEKWMEDNGFSETGKYSGPSATYCVECGVVLVGNRYGMRYLVAHAPVCSVKPRELVPMLTDSECKQFPRVRYV